MRVLFPESHGRQLAEALLAPLVVVVADEPLLKRWRNAASSGKPCFNDITSISSYSKENEMVEFGYNRDHEDLPQINLGLVVDSGSKLPLHYHVHDGDIRDVSTLERVMKEGFAFNMRNLLLLPVHCRHTPLFRQGESRN